MVHYLKSLLGFAVIGSLHLSSWAQSDWPKAKPVTLVVAFAAGSSTDIVARSLTQKLNELTGGNFIVENKGGAGGNIATSQVNSNKTNQLKQHRLRLCLQLDQKSCQNW